MGSVRVPSEAGDGAAKITLHIENWKELPAATFVVPLDSAPGKLHAAKPWKEMPR